MIIPSPRGLQSTRAATLPSQELIEMYSAGEQPRPDAGECHRAMRGTTPADPVILREEQ